MKSGLRLCRFEIVRRGRSRWCRGFACRNGYCWFHHLAMFGDEMWGDHLWMPVLPVMEAAGA